MQLSRLSVVVICLFIGVCGSTQQFGGNPSTLKWKQINTDTVRIIFPEGIEPTANRVATVVHNLQKDHSASIGANFQKINIVLQNQNTNANGYVGLGPWRSEFYLFAPLNSFDQGSINWADKLSVHEYRHVQQFSNFNVGLSKVAGFLFGQEGRALANSAAIPDYFFEGDAVFNETALTQQGRGRQPLFLNGYQSLQRQGKQYAYMKLRNGSLKDYVPDHYQLGYLLVGYGRQKYGADFWRKVTQNAARFKPLVYPWQGAIKKFSGKPYKQFVGEALDYYKKLWSSAGGSESDFITPAKSYPQDYKYATITNEGALIVLKNSYSQIPGFYKISANGTEEKLATRGIAYDDYFSYNNNQIVYATLKPGLRWGYQEYSDIYLLNTATKRLKKISRSERFFSPDISHDGQRVAVVEMKTNQLSNLLVIDLEGKRQFRMNGAPGIVYSYPKFSGNDSGLFTMLRNAKGEMAFQKINLANSRVENILPFGNWLIGLPVVQGDTVYFTSSNKGSDEVWAYTENSQGVFRVGNFPGGLYHAGYDNKNNRLIASVFTAKGYRLAALPMASLLWQKLDFKTDALPNLFISEALKQENPNTLNSIPTRDFAVTKYKKGTNLINFHSARPYYEQPEYSYIIYGQNVLNTFRTELAYTYNENEKSSQVGLNMLYGASYVQPNLSVSQTWNRTIRYNRDTTLYYNETNAGFDLSLPLNLSNDKHFRYLAISSGINTRQLRQTDIGKNIYRNADFNFLQNRITYSSQIQKAVQQIYPHWAQSILVQSRNIINKYTANQLLLSGNFYLPGVHANHSLVLSAAYSARDTMNQYYFSDNFPFSRGYTSVDFPRMWRFGANYHFPLLYPDFGIAQIVYFKRLRANVFYDYTTTKSLRSGLKYKFSSTGVELFF